MPLTRCYAVEQIVLLCVNTPDLDVCGVGDCLPSEKYDCKICGIS